MTRLVHLKWPRWPTGEVSSDLLRERRLRCGKETLALTNDWNASWYRKIVAVKVQGAIQNAKSLCLIHTQCGRIGQLGSHHDKVGESGEPLATLHD